MRGPAPDTRAAPAGSDAGAVGQVVLAALGFSLISIFTILATRRGTPLTMVLAGRYVVAAIALLPALRLCHSQGRSPMPLDPHGLSHQRADGWGVRTSAHRDKIDVAPHFRLH